MVGVFILLFLVVRSMWLAYKCFFDDSEAVLNYSWRDFLKLWVTAMGLVLVWDLHKLVRIYEYMRDME